MSENTLFNDCRACKMKFDTRAQLENHVKKFCITSEYGDTLRLEGKYQKELKELKKSQIPGARDFPPEQPQSVPSKRQDYGVTSLEGLQDKHRQEDLEYNRLQRLGQQRRENEMDDELNKFKDDRQKIRLKRDDDQQAFSDLLHDLESKKEKEIRARIEKDQIRRALMDLEKAKLTTIEQEKKRQLEGLIAEREALRSKENDLLEDIQNLEGNTRTLDIMRKEEMDKVNNVIDGLKLQKGENKRVNEQMVVERSDKVAALRLKREQLEGERLRIMDNLDKIKNGDMSGMKKGGMNLVTNAKQILGEMREMGGYGGDHNTKRPPMNVSGILPFDPDEAYRNRHDAPDYARAEYNDKYRQANTPGALGNFREGIERQADLMMNQPLDQSVFQNMSRVQEPQKQQMNRSMNNQAREPQNQVQLYNNAPPQQQQVEMMQNAWGVQMPQFQDNQFKMQPAPQYQQWGMQQPQPQKQPPIQNPNAMFGSFALNQMTEGYKPQKNKRAASDPWDLFSRNNEFFLQNELRGADLTEEERVLMSLTAQETDSMRIMSRIPVGTELYRFKMEQFKELSTMRSEIDKIVQEQRLQDARRDFEIERREEDRIYDNEKWVDDNRKFIIENRLRRDNTQNKTSNVGYNPSTGFVVHWDYNLGLPRRTNYGQIVFGVYNGQNVIYQARLVDPRETETENQQLNRVIFGDSHQVYEVPPHPDTLMIMEVQIPFSKRVEENVGRTETYGWTMVDLFDHNKQLKRGKFKCPVYYGPTDPSITVEEIANLEPIPNCWMYFRIGYPNDKEFSQTKTIYPEQSMHEYIVPYIHLRGLFGKREGVAKRQNTQTEQYSIRHGNRGYKMIEEVIEESQLMNQTVMQRQGGQQEDMEEEITDIPPPMQNYQYETEEQEKSMIQPSGKKKGLRLIVYRVDNHQARSHLRVMAALLEEGNLVLDDNGLPVAFNTTIHNPLDLRPQMRQNLPEKLIIPLTTSNPEYNGMNNKAKGSDIIFQEEYRIFRNINAMWRKNKKDLYIGLQVVEKPEPVEMQAKELSDTQNNYAGLDFDLMGWQFLKISEESGDLLTGRFKMQLFKPPLRRPPIDKTKVQAMEQVLDFALYEFEYDDQDILDFKKQSKKKRPPPKKITEPEDVELDNNPYIPLENQQWLNKPFEKRMGVDFYIDAIRYAPDKVTVCKIYMEVYNRRYEKIFEAETASPDLNTMSYNPMFFFRRELRKDKFDPTCIALMTVITVDKSLNQNRIVGYAAINLFLNPYTKKQPDNHNEPDYVLYDGNYQIPLFSQQLDRTPPFDLKKIYSHERSPCCSMLVRIRQAPLSDDGLRCLSITEFKDPKQQIDKGLMCPRPIYGQTVYNTQLCPITESENELFSQRTLRTDQSVREAAYLLIKGEQINKEMKDKEIYQYIDKRLFLTTDTFMIDMMYFAKYRAQAGFKFIMDGLHNVISTSNAYVVLYSLSIPGAYYIEPRDPTQAHMTSTYNWDSIGNSPQYADEWFKFKENINRYQNIIIDVKSVPITKIDGVISDVGWTVLPVFSPDGYIQSNIYQLPLFKGSVPKQVIQDISKTDCWPYLREQVKNKKLFYLEFMGVIVRLVDSQREGHFQKRFDCDRLDYRYLPSETIKQWSYNPAVELKQLNDKKMNSYIPFKDNPSSYNRKITEYFANSLGLKQYLGS